MFRIPVDLFSFPERQSQRSQRRRHYYDQAMEDPMDLFLGMYPLFGSSVFQNTQRGQPKQPERWIKRLNLPGFEPSDIKVTVKDDKITVHAQHTEGEDGNTDSHESVRTLTVPDNVDLQQMSSHLNVHGVLVIQASYKQEEKEFENQIEVSKGEDEEKTEIEPSLNELKLYDEIQDETYFDSSLSVSDKGDGSFKLNLNLDRFPKENIQVLHKDGSLIVKAEQKKEEDGMKMTEYYVSEHSLPENVDPSELKCMKRSDGRLIVQAPDQQREGKKLETE